ncbi:N-acetyltransferase GCN5 [Protomyces lactucae-debilis]|uniref:N-acetyltransferase GCN5 n=1 Tax=Protomyces lactucae-debilis TaxID=2754530 RepID=A0A1Y2FIS0_PROLT|nr:N-acetyltransferase GCN5 [Protomyces lactucae-debilis]ORY83823.1 N-acetyltransferase GCN5 [Protomyces lactucae-debilis]
MTVSVRECSLQPSVRRATVNDAFILHEHCARLARYHNAEEDFHLSLSALRTALTKGPCYALLALDEEGRPAGSAIYSSTFSTWSGKSNLFLEHLFVDPAFRGQGHGKTLLAQLRRLAGTGRIEWSVQASNVKSIQFYESAGAHVHDGWLEMRMEGAQ